LSQVIQNLEVKVYSRAYKDQFSNSY